MSKKIFDFVMVIAGILMLGAGFLLLKLVADPQGMMLSLPYVCIGIGCGVFGHGMGNVINRRVLHKHPEIQKRKEIEIYDERNVTISSKAKAKAYDMMVFVFGALMVSFALMGVDLIEILLLVFSYLFVVGYGIYNRLKYEKEM